MPLTIGDQTVAGAFFPKTISSASNPCNEIYVGKLVVDTVKFKTDASEMNTTTDDAAVNALINSAFTSKTQYLASRFFATINMTTPLLSLTSGGGGGDIWEFVNDASDANSFGLKYGLNGVVLKCTPAGTLHIPSVDATNHVQTSSVVLTDQAGTNNLWRIEHKTISSTPLGGGEIGLTTNAFGLSYNGAVRLKLSDVGNLFIDNNIYANHTQVLAIHTLSDDRYKSRERPLPDDCVSIIQQLKPSRYLLHRNHEVPVDVEDSDLTGVETHEQAGLIAQDLEQIPELAFIVREFEGVKTVEYNSLLPYVIKSVQELADRVAALEAS